MCSTSRRLTHHAALSSLFHTSFLFNAIERASFCERSKACSRDLLRSRAAEAHKIDELRDAALVHNRVLVVTRRAQVPYGARRVLLS